MIYPLIVGIVHAPDDAATILIETFWEAWQQADQHMPTNTLPWLRQIARRLSLDYLRRALAVQRSHIQASVLVDPPVSVPVPAIPFG